MNFAPTTTSGDGGRARCSARSAQLDPDMPVILMTAWTSLETAGRARQGRRRRLHRQAVGRRQAASPRCKNLVEPARAARRRTRACARSGTRARSELGRALRPARPGVRRARRCTSVVALACQVARADVPVLITGPNGAGKEKIAEIVQANSRRKRRAVRHGQLRRAARRADRGRAVRRRGRRVHRREQARATASSRRPTAARCSSTRSATCRRPAR